LGETDYSFATTGPASRWPTLIKLFKTFQPPAPGRGVSRGTGAVWPQLQRIHQSPRGRLGEGNPARGPYSILRFVRLRRLHHAGQENSIGRGQSGDVTLTCAALKRLTFANELIVCADGAEALDYLSARPVRKRDPKQMPVVVCSTEAPENYGIEVLRRIRSNTITQQLPVVILTSSKEQSDVAACTNMLQQLRP